MPSSNRSASSRPDKVRDRLPDPVAIRQYHRALIDRLNEAHQARDRAGVWNTLVVLATYALAGIAGLRPQELPRLRVRHVSLLHDLLVLPRPKGTTRGADPRVVMINPVLRSYLEPLVRSLSSQRDVPLLSAWNTHQARLEPRTYVGLERLGQELLGGGLPPAEIGRYRHLYSTERTLRELDRGGAAALPSYLPQRLRSASLGHAQSGGWDLQLPVEFSFERALVGALDPLGAGPLFLPSGGGLMALPPYHSDVRLDRERHLPRPAASTWVLAGLEHECLPPDVLPPVLRALWSFDWRQKLGVSDSRALQVALVVHLAVAGEGLVEPLAPTLQHLRWDDVQPNEEGLLLWLRPPGHRAPEGVEVSDPQRHGLLVWVGAAERVLFDRLRQYHHLTGPFAGLATASGEDPEDVTRLITHLTGRAYTLGQLQATNRVMHLKTHRHDWIGYLSGRASRRVRTFAPPSSRTGTGSSASTASPIRARFAPLLAALRTRREAAAIDPQHLDRLLDETMHSTETGYSWRDQVAAWPPTQGPVVDVLSDAYILHALRRRCAAPRRDRRHARWRSPNLLRALTDDLITLSERLGDRPVHEATLADVVSAVGVGQRQRGDDLVRVLHLTGRALGRPRLIRQLRVPQLPTTRMTYLPDLEELVHAMAHAAPAAEQPLVLLLLLTLTVARVAEVARALVRDVQLDETALVLGLGRAKNGRRAVRTTPIPPAWKALVPRLVEDLWQRSDQPWDRLFDPLGTSAEQLASRFRRLAARAGFPSVTPHALRNMAATEAEARGDDRAEIADRLGHAWIDSAATAYVVLDLRDQRQRARRLAEPYGRMVTLPGAAQAMILGKSETWGQRQSSVRLEAFCSRSTPGDLYSF